MGFLDYGSLQIKDCGSLINFVLREFKDCGSLKIDLFLPRRRASDLIAQQTGGIRVPATGGKKGFGR